MNATNADTFADDVHLVAHLAIFGVLLMRVDQGHEITEDRAIIAVLALIAAIAIGIDVGAARALVAGPLEPPEPGLMMVAVLGLGANMTTAWLFQRPAQSRWSFRAALAHELADGMITIAGLLGAFVIALRGWCWVDPALSFAVGLWLTLWVLRLVRMRVRHGARAWTVLEH
jgi:cobalt-zinc-cadmium efflux system protein